MNLIPWSVNNKLERNRLVKPNTCPECGGPVEMDLGCHTWPRRRTVDNGHLNHSANEAHPGTPCPEPEYTEQYMSCMPCDSATIWSCETRWMDEDELEGRTPCDWTWTEGLNPGNPRYPENETRNPHWEETS